MNRFPIFIPSKGRSQTCYTMKALDAVGVSDYLVFVEPQDAEAYSAVLGSSRIAILPHRDKGLVATRNFIWDYAEASGYKKFWTFDDNIDGFYRLNRNLKVPVADGTFLRVIEDFSDRYSNVVICGMNYFMFCKRKDRLPPFVANTRVYSNMLIQTDAPYRNEGFYNDDTDLCLRVLKDGFCTVLFNAFLIMKSTTMTVSGGMTPHYLGEGRKKMAQELADKHPDVCKVSWKFGRYQHHVDYSPFRRNQLKFLEGFEPKSGVDNYGMELLDDFAEVQELVAG